MVSQLYNINLDEPILSHTNKDYPSLRQDMSIEDALAYIRRVGVGERIIYFYVLDGDMHLVGVVPTRRLLISEPKKLLEDVMIKKVISIPHTATVFDACERFVLYKYLMFPVVDEQKHMIGTVDVSLFAEEVYDIAERQQYETIFESIGVHIEQVKGATPLKAFYFRFPWLLATITSGVVCALLASAYEATLAQAIALAFFLTLVLGLGESVSIQSTMVTLHLLRTSKPSFRWYLNALHREARTAIYLGCASGVIVGLFALVWRGAAPVALAIGSGILLSICSACLIGLSIPVLLHTLKLDPKIASGPITLALADIFTLLCYFTMAAILL
jgi:magnesium transporter